MSFHTGRRSVGKLLPALAAAAVLCFTSASEATASPVRVDELVRAALQLDRDAARGAALFKQNCARCHGAQGLGSSKRLIPSLAGQRQAYLIKQLADFTELERESSDMHAVVARPGLAEPQAWADIAAFLSEQNPVRFPETGDGKGVELGEAIFQEQCASCHDEDARGDGDGFVPSLRNQHYSYLVQQMHAITTWHRYNIDVDLVRYLGSLDKDELTGVADYLSRLRGPTRDRAKLRDDGSIQD